MHRRPFAIPLMALAACAFSWAGTTVDAVALSTGCAALPDTRTETASTSIGGHVFSVTGTFETGETVTFTQSGHPLYSWQISFNSFDSGSNPAANGSILNASPGSVPASAEYTIAQDGYHDFYQFFQTYDSSGGFPDSTVTVTCTEASGGGGGDGSGDGSGDGTGDGTGGGTGGGDGGGTSSEERAAREADAIADILLSKEKTTSDLYSGFDRDAVDEVLPDGGQDRGPGGLSVPIDERAPSVGTVARPDGRTEKIDLGILIPDARIRAASLLQEITRIDDLLAGDTVLSIRAELWNRRIALIEEMKRVIEDSMWEQMIWLEFQHKYIRARAEALKSRIDRNAYISRVPFDDVPETDLNPNAARERDEAYLKQLQEQDEALQDTIRNLRIDENFLLNKLRNAAGQAPQVDPIRDELVNGQVPLTYAPETAPTSPMDIFMDGSDQSARFAMRFNGIDSYRALSSNRRLSSWIAGGITLFDDGSAIGRQGAEGSIGTGIAYRLAPQTAISSVFKLRFGSLDTTGIDRENDYTAAGISVSLTRRMGTGLKASVSISHDHAWIETRSSGTTGRYDAGKTALSARLSGRINASGGIVIRPSAELGYAWSQRAGYTDSSSSVVPGSRNETATASAGLEIERTFLSLQGPVRSWTPFGGAKLHHDFDNASSLAVGSTVVEDASTRATFTAGMRAMFRNDMSIDSRIVFGTGFDGGMNSMSLNLKLRQQF
ncbi:autotransporter outer membrane beta-barrel domain-containing protein [Oricola indica]|jgi:hypothetical protein|uniref:autotransporter outer membrane beta-barrel domain-containing protein n=1 Tax=Oricola indica TaxID=2872591 RepID=UPI001CBB8268|nr:autotransporter outer membrane beta-barrel domain-containing protein [Oricola indica]